MRLAVDSLISLDFPFGAGQATFACLPLLAHPPFSLLSEYANANAVADRFFLSVGLLAA
jgi:hypothetical protein